MSTEKYIKTRKKIKRGHKQTGVNIEFYQHRVLEAQKLNLSLLVRDYLDSFLESNFPEELKKSKALENTYQDEE